MVYLAGESAVLFCAKSPVLFCTSADHQPTSLPKRGPCLPRHSADFNSKPRAHFVSTNTPLVQPYRSTNMGIIRTSVLTGLLGTASAAAYLAAANPVISPLSSSDPIWKSALYKKYNPSKNPSTQDVCIKRISLSKLRPELLQKDGDLALEFCRGLWSGWGTFSSIPENLLATLPLVAVLTPLRLCSSAQISRVQVPWT